VFRFLETLAPAGGTSLQTALRGIFGWSSRRDYWFPDIRSLGGAELQRTLGRHFAALRDRLAAAP